MSIKSLQGRHRPTACDTTLESMLTNMPSLFANLRLLKYFLNLMKQTEVTDCCSLPVLSYL